MLFRISAVYIKLAFIWSLLLSKKAVIVGTWLVTVALVAVVVCWWLLMSAIGLCPDSPDPTSGHVVPYNNHGTIQYMTEVQHNLLWQLPVIFVVVFALGVWVKRQRVLNEG
jgi:hypothetical protein